MSFLKVIFQIGWIALFFASPIVTSAATTTAEVPENITIGFIPGGNPANLKKQSVELAKQMQAELNVPIKIFISKDYQSLAEAMQNKKIDFAFFSALTYVYGEEKTQAKVLLKKVWAEPYYYSALISRQDSKIKNLTQVKGKRIVFVDDHSTSGYLYPQVMFKKKKINLSDFSKVIFSGNHSKSVEMLENAEADVAAVFSNDPQGHTGAWVKFSQKPNLKYNMLWVSDPIPNDPFTVRQDFYDRYPKFTHTLMIALIDIFQKNKESKIFSEILGSQDLMPATSRQYDPVREMVKSLNPVVK